MSSELAIESSLTSLTWKILLMLRCLKINWLSILRMACHGNNKVAIFLYNTLFCNHSQIFKIKKKIEFFISNFFKFVYNIVFIT